MNCSTIKIKQPFAIRWKIPETNVQELKSSDGYLRSKAYGIDGSTGTYSIMLVPNGSGGKAMVALSVANGGPIAAEYTVSIESANYSKTCSAVSGDIDGWILRLCTTDELFNPASRFIINGEMDITLDGFLLVEKDAPPNACRKIDGGNDSLFMDLWNQEYKDFRIICNGQEVQAHKLILSTRSPVFAAMFQPHTREAQEGVVVIPDFPFIVVESAIKLCYNPSPDCNLSLDELMLLLQFLDKYNIQSIKDNIENFMIPEINESNVCQLANCSVISNAPKLRTKCAEFLLACLKNTKAVCDFDHLDKDFCWYMTKNGFYNVSQ